MDKFHAEAALGEKKLDSYHERYRPLVYQDIYHGKLGFQDEAFFQGFMNNYLFSHEGQYAGFLRSELTAGMLCPNDTLSTHMEDIRYAYRLIALSYLLEGQWHLKTLSDQLSIGAGCKFNLTSWLDRCRPKSREMKKYISRLKQFNPRYVEKFPSGYSADQWLKEFNRKDFQWYSHYRLEESCIHCTRQKLDAALINSCSENEELMSQICSENDELYGLSSHRDAYFLLSQSNIINTFNQSGQGQGCLRRFSEVLSHKEVNYPALINLFPSLRSFLKTTHGERFLQGRTFFFGAGKEFEEKGLTNFYVKEQPLVVKGEPKPAALTVVVEAPKVVEKAPAPQPEKVIPVVARAPEPEIKKPNKSAFLQAAEVRAASNLAKMDVDMLKLKFDYFFTLHMINNLSEKLKSFMGQEALKEMITFDKLGTKEGPVPLLFIKFMIDMEEHQGLWNLLSVLGARFYVSNEIDAAFTPAAEYVELTNNESTGYQWQLSIIKPY